jgi:serine protease AprX
MLQHQPRPPAGRILIAGDDPGLRSQVGQPLGHDGHLVRIAADATRAVTHLQAEIFDLLVIHASLPPSEIQRILEGARQLRPAPVVFLIACGRTIQSTVETLRRSAYLASCDREEEFPDPVREEPAPMTLDEMERAHILSVLRHCRGNKKRAATLLGINRSSLYGKLKRLGIMPVARFAGALSAVLAVACVLSADGSAEVSARQRKISPDVLRRVTELMDEAHPDQPVPLILQTWGAPSREEMDKIEELDGSAGRAFESIHGFAAELPARNVHHLATSARVKRISLDWEVRPALDTVRVSSGAAMADERLGLRGSGVTVAVLDSGVSQTVDLEKLIEIDIVEEDGIPADYFGHGTHVAGIIAGTGQASLCEDCVRTFSGIASGAQIVSVKVLDGRGDGRVSDVIAGVDWVIRNHEARGIRIMSLALGHPVGEPFPTDPLCQAVERAWQAGIVVVVSAGNAGRWGYATITSPGNHPSVITVGAAEDWDSEETSDDMVAPFSSMGPTLLDGVIKPDIIAPGTGIVSLRSPGSLLDDALSRHRLMLSDYMLYPAFGDGEAPYITLSGTSTASAAVAGAAAILLSQDPDASPDDVKARLLIGARKINEAIVARGAGLLNIATALELGAAGVTATETRSPRLHVMYDEDDGRTVEIQDAGTAWGNPLTWSSELIWGEPSTWGVSPAWTDAAVWAEIDRGLFSEPDDDTGVSIWGLR